MHAALLVLALAAVASAKTNIAGCVSTKTTNQWGEASMLYYVPTDGEICEFLDCGGGRAPPKTTVPGCAQYEGTATYSPRYLAGFDATSTAASSSAAAATVQSSPAVTSVATSTIASSTSASASVPATSFASSIASPVISSAASPSPPAAASTAVGQPAGNSTSTGSPATSSTLTPVGAGSARSVGAISALMGVVAAGFAFLW
ncbi:putative cell surface protein [Amylocarpus encephaloides]|uniref:Cell surface protein n=1 Tax=Amylocarpus encephaloides TaxID=45428 RepID=A0A9P7YBD5_9HELO|nr:putative cell surface protein [Amylocarpus encephaloides]